MDSDIDMDNIYEEVEIANMYYDKTQKIFKYLCPCGDNFVISLVYSIINE